MMSPDDAQTRAELCAQRMWEGDRASHDLGMSLEAVSPGTATLAMTLTDRMVNGHGTAHGGFIFALADSAFAFACNSHGPRAVAAQCTIAYLAPGRLGDRLLATAQEVARKGRSGVYDVHVTCEGQAVAEFRGHARVVAGSWLDEGAEPREDEHRP